MMVSPPIKSVQLSVRYDRVEDRLMLQATDAEGKSVAMFLTRRLTARLINEFARILERTSMAARSSTAEMRDDVIMFEHQGAVQETRAKRAAVKPNRTGSSTADNNPLGRPLSGSFELVQNIQITARPTVFEIVVKGTKPLAVMVLKRAELHQLLEIIKQKSVSAGWSIQPDIAWLASDSGVLTIN